MPTLRRAVLLSCGGMLSCAALLPAAELPASVGAAAGQAATVRPLLPPGPLGPLPADLELAAPFVAAPAPGTVGVPPYVGALAPPAMGFPSAAFGAPAAALVQPPGALIGPENSIAPALTAAPPTHDPAAQNPGALCGCGCPHCAAGGGGAHVYAVADTLPKYAPTDAESFEATWLPNIEEDWFGRPVYGGAYAGWLLGDEIIRSQLQLEPGLLTGVRFGQDYGRRWAMETNIAYAMAEVTNLEGPELRRDADLFMADTSVVFSRYATKRLRPYLSAGLGTAYLDVIDHQGNALREFVPLAPLGAGFQYRYDDFLVLRVDLRDNLTLGKQSGLETMHNLTLSGGLELRFGISPNVYYPWTARAQSP